MTAELKVIECQQGSKEWLEARMGIPSASMMKTVMAKGDGKTRTTYMYQLAAEIISGVPCPTWDGNDDTQRGNQLEPEAKSMYAEAVGLALAEAGFGIRMGIGASPDLLVGDEGGAEMKSVRGHTQVGRLLKNEIPTEYLKQMHTSMFVWNRKWWDFVSFAPKMPLFVKRLYRDEIEIARIITEANSFSLELKQIVKQLEGK